MALVNIDPKALEHACLCAGRSVHHFDRMGDDLPLRASIVAHARAIERLEATEARHAAELREQAERFEAFRQEVSDAIESCMLGPIAEERLNPFILPAPDPLAECLLELDLSEDEQEARHDAEWLVKTIEKRGGKLTWREG